MTWRSKNGGFTGRGSTAYLGVAKDITGAKGHTHTMQLNDPFTGKVTEVAKGDGIVRATGTVAPIMPRGNPHAGKGQKLLKVGGGRKAGNSTKLLRIKKP